MTLSFEKLRVYESYQGDLDGYVRSRRKSSRVISDEEWYLIDDLLMRLTAATRSLATASFVSDLEERIKAAAPHSDVERELRALAMRQQQS